MLVDGKYHHRLVCETSRTSRASSVPRLHVKVTSIVTVGHKTIAGWTFTPSLSGTEIALLHFLLHTFICDGQQACYAIKKK